VGGILTIVVGLGALAWLRRHRTIGVGPTEPVPPAVRKAPGRL
jgi:hypothetical protein